MRKAGKIKNSITKIDAEAGATTGTMTKRTTTTTMITILTTKTMTKMTTIATMTTVTMKTTTDPWTSSSDDNDDEEDDYEDNVEIVVFADPLNYANNNDYIDTSNTYFPIQIFDKLMLGPLHLIHHPHVLIYSHCFYSPR